MRQHVSPVKALVVLLIILSFGIGLFFRTTQLNTLPVSISHDQLDHAINGLSIRYSGKDFEDQHFFWDLMPTATHTYTAELGALWHALFPQLTDLPVAQAKIPNVFFGIIFAVALTIFSYQIFKSKLISALVFAGILLSPWHIYVSRTAYEAPVSLAFMLAGIVCFWQYFDADKKRAKLLLLLTAMLSMLASFYTYHGYKLSYPVIFALIFFWQNSDLLSLLRNKRELATRLIPLLLMILAWLFVFLLFLVRMQAGAYGDRSGEISILNGELLGQQVNTQRQESLSSPQKAIFSNKITALSELTAKNLAEALDFKMLFITGFDNSFALGLWAHGFLYLLQAPLIAIGTYWLWIKYRKDAPYYFSLGATSLIPVLIHTGTSITLRSSLYIPLLIILTALGGAALIRSRYVGKRLLISLLIIGFTLSVANFYYFYTVRYPVYAVDASMLDKRILSSYLSRNDDTIRPVKIFTTDPYNTARMYVYLGGLVNKQSLSGLKIAIPSYGTSTINFENLTFTEDCLEYKLGETDIIIAEPGLAKKCEIEEQEASAAALLGSQPTENKLLVLPSPRDNRDYYRIYHDQLCIDGQVPSFISIQNLSQFNLEQLSNHEFCQNWTRFETF